MHNSRTLTTAAALIAAALFVHANGAGAGKGAKVDICHYDADTGLYHVINISENAVAHHVANHGDSAPGSYHADADGDGFGDPNGATDACPNPGFVGNAADCNDGDAAINPAAAEICGDKIDNNCSGRADEGCVGCVDILLHCDASSDVLEHVCGEGVHALQPVTAANISYVVFGAGVSSVTLHHCDNGGPLSNQSLEITTSTNLCDLPGGCCDGGNRWNDEVCAVELH